MYAPSSVKMGSTTRQRLTDDSSSARMTIQSKEETIRRRRLRRPTRPRREVPAFTRRHSNPRPAASVNRTERHTTARTVGTTDAPHGPMAMVTKRRTTITWRARSTRPLRALLAPTTPNRKIKSSSLNGNALAQSSFPTSPRARPTPISRTPYAAGCFWMSSCGATIGLLRFLSSTRRMPESSSTMFAGTTCTSETSG